LSRRRYWCAFFLFSLLSFSRSALSRNPATPQQAETATEAATTALVAITLPVVTTVRAGDLAAAKEVAVEGPRMRVHTTMAKRATALWPALPVH
jgi:hypothetical protein